jgi:hypothetical protein
MAEEIVCIDLPGKRLERFAICSCGAHFPECDLEDALVHGSAEGAYNHNWVYIHPKWKEKFNDTD